MIWISTISRSSVFSAFVYSLSTYFVRFFSFHWKIKVSLKCPFKIVKFNNCFFSSKVTSICKLMNNAIILACLFVNFKIQKSFFHQNIKTLLKWPSMSIAYFSRWQIWQNKIFKECLLFLSTKFANYYWLAILSIFCNVQYLCTYLWRNFWDYSRPLLFTEGYVLTISFADTKTSSNILIHYFSLYLVGKRR